MADLVDRQALLDAMDKHCDNVCPYSKQQRFVMCGACPLGTAFDVIEQQPSIEAVEVVFCGDCIHHKDSPVLGTYCEVHDWCSKDEDYCSFAERRDDEAD